MALAAAALAGEQEQEEKRRVVLPSVWPEGTKYDLIIEKGRRDYEEETLVKQGWSTSHVAVEVARASAEGYLLRWTFIRTTLPKQLEWLEPVAFAARITEGMVLELRADEFGCVVGLENVDEVRERVRQVIELMRSSLRASDLGEREAQAVFDSLAEQLLGQGMEAMVINVARLFTLASGGAFVLGEEQAYEDALPCPLNGELIPSKAAFLLEKVDDETGSALVTWRQRMDQEKATQVIGQALADLARKAGRDISEGLQEYTLDVRDEARFVYDLATGIPISVSHSRDIQIGPKRRVDWLRFVTVQAK